MHDTRAHFISVIFSVMCNIFLAISIYLRYDIWFKWSKSVERFSKFDTLINTGQWKPMVGEMIILLIAPTPMLEEVEYTEYNQDFNYDCVYEVNDYFLAFCFIRFYLLVKVVLFSTYFIGPRA